MGVVPMSFTTRLAEIFLTRVAAALTGMAVFS